MDKNKLRVVDGQNHPAVDWRNVPWEQGFSDIVERVKAANPSGVLMVYEQLDGTYAWFSWPPIDSMAAELARVVSIMFNPEDAK